MIRELSHAEAAELLSEAALDALSREEQAAVLGHAANCAECGPELAALRDALTQLALATPPVADGSVRRARVRARLLARARADLAIADSPADGAETRQPGAVRRAGSRPSVAPPARRRWAASTVVVAWSCAAAAGIAAVVIAAVVGGRTGRLQQKLGATQQASALAIAALRDSVIARDTTLSHLTGKQVSVVQLTAAAPRAPWAWMFWDHAADRWNLVARDLPATPPGKTYQLWLVTRASKKISAGTFSPAPDGTAQLQATYPLARDSLSALAVTEEPAGGVAQPTGPLVIAGTAGR